MNRVLAFSIAGVLFAGVAGLTVVNAQHRPEAVFIAGDKPVTEDQIRAKLQSDGWRGRGERTEGAGLGLSIVSEIMRTHGGSVTLADRQGGGAVFTLAFPSAGGVAGTARVD